MKPGKRFILALLLTLPLIAFVVHHYTCHSSDLHPTGFTVDENVLYMSYAHQYSDQQNFSPAYSNPFDGDPQSPKIYFQPVTLVLAAALKTGADPGLIFSLFGLLMAFCCIYMGLLIIEHLLPDLRHRVLISILFTWGGGLTALAGIGAAVYSGASLQSWSDAIYIADPANGWWGLNWGRTLFIPLEAFYHFLFLLNIYLLLKQRWKAAVLFGAFLSISHPFTGIEYLLIVSGWMGLERILLKNKNIPWWVLISHLLLIGLHAGYYLFFLNSYAAHRQLFSQYSAGWTYSFRVFIPAYLLTAILVFLAARVKKTLHGLLAIPHQRLFLCWAIIAFLLSKHEWFIKPMQPIHFTRGYIWAGLFLLGIPGLLWLIEYGKQTVTRRLLYFSFVILLLLDNTLWSANLFREKATVEWEGYITTDTKNVFAFLEKNSSPNDLLVGNARLVNYMANVYSSANSWLSHPYNTPRIAERQEQMNTYFASGIKPAEWNGRHILIVLDKREKLLPVIAPSLTSNKMFENNSYIIFTP
jgi:hypothetical protein